MPVTLTKNAPNFPFQVIAADPAAPLPPEAAGVKVTTNPEGIAVVSLDPNPVPVANPFDPASGTSSVISGVARPTAVGNTTVTAAILNVDGSSLAEATDTVTVVEPAEGTAAWSGTLFGATTPISFTGKSARAAAAKAHEPESKSHHSK